MKRKSYIMPIVLLIFSLVVVAFFSIYHRTLNTHNHKNSKEKAISKKLKEISLEEILSTKATLDFVNSKLNKRENFNLKVNINDLLKVNNINDFSQNFENYDLRLNSKKVKKKLNFYDRKNGALSYFVRQYEIFFEIRNNNELTEYKIVDKNRIENYLFDLQVKGFVDGKLKMLSDDFYFNLNNDFSNLYERIFSNEIQNTYSEDLRIYDYKESAEEYNRFIKKYPDSPTTELLGYYLEEVNLDKPEDNDSEALSKMIDEYIEKYFYLGSLENRKKGNLFSEQTNTLLKEFNKNKEEVINKLKTLNKEEANKFYEDYLESNNEILEKMNENDYIMLDNAFYIGEGDIDKEKLNKQNKFLDNYGLEVIEIEEGFMLTEKKDFYYNIFKNYVSDDYRDFIKLCSEDIDYIDYFSSLEEHPEIIADKVINWEKFLEKYPDSKLRKKANDICYSYRDDYILALTSSQTTEALKNGKINEGVKELNRFINKYPNSPTTEIIKYYLENYKDEDIDQVISKKLNE